MEADRKREKRKSPLFPAFPTGSPVGGTHGRPPGIPLQENNNMQYYDTMKILLPACLFLLATGAPLRAYDSAAEALSDGSSKLEAKQYAGAKTAFQAAVDMAPDATTRINAREKLAGTLLEAGDYDECRKVSEEVLVDRTGAVDWPGVHCLGFIAESYRREGRMDEMQATFQRATELDSKKELLTWLQLRFAGMLHDEKQTDAARAIWQQILDDPQATSKYISWAQYWLARTSQEQGNPDEAVTAARKVLVIDNADPDAVAATKKFLNQLGAQ